VGSKCIWSEQIRGSDIQMQIGNKARQSTNEDSVCRGIITSPRRSHSFIVTTQNTTPGVNVCSNLYHPSKCRRCEHIRANSITPASPLHVHAPSCATRTSALATTVRASDLRSHSNVRSTCALPVAVCSVIGTLLQLLLSGLHGVRSHILLDACGLLETGELGKQA